MAGVVRVTGVRELDQALRAVAVRVNVATPVALKSAAAVVEKRAKANLELKSHRRGTPTPSRPGEPPAKIDGHLRDSFKTKPPVSTGAGIWVCELYPDIVYAAIHEFGGMAGRGHRSRIPKRPYLRPSLNQAVASGDVRRAFEAAWVRALRV